MSAFLSWPILWAQAAAAAPPPEISRALRNTLFWFFLAGEPLFTIPGLLGAMLTWLKAVSLLSLLGWLGYWLSTAVRERVVGVGKWFDYFGLAALVLIPATVLVKVLETEKRITVHDIGPIPLTTLLGFLAVACVFVWSLVGIWGTIRRLGRPSDYLVTAGVLAAFALGIGVGVVMEQNNFLPMMVGTAKTTWQDGVVFGARLSMTFMGYVVLVRVGLLFLGELLSVRARRLYSIARLSLYEANRKMWAPWVVIIVFGLVLAFTHWFLQAPRPAEMSRLYVGTLTLLCSLLLTSMVTILTPISLPTDIQQQTIYTVVTKPVRRLEIIWGRMIGYMALVTVLVFVFGGVSLIYLWRTVGLTIDATEKAAVKAEKENRTRDQAQLNEQALQLRSRLQARVPVKGSLSFLDSKGTPHAMGIDVGQEQSMKEPRSHIEGATPATAIWRYGIVPDPFSPVNRPVMLDRRIPVDDFLARGTVEGELNRTFEIDSQIKSAEQAKSQPNIPPAEVSRLDGAIARNRDELERAQREYENLKKKADDLEAAGKGDEAAALHAPPIVLEMSFNVYRTTKGRVGEPVYAELRVTNPNTGAEYSDIFPIKEYYTNRQIIPDASILAGSFGTLKIEIYCMSPTQYLGMAESDLYLLSSSGSFGANYMKGLLGIWLQAMILTAIGVFAGTFLSWPVALLTTIAFFIAGQLAFGFLVDFTRQAILGGGPFESLIRLVTHDNQMSELAPTAGVVVAKTLDSLVMPVMSMLVYVVPNFQALDVSNSVADGFAVSWSLIIANTLLALAYALPFSIAGYFILKNREVAA
jgi:hypothetical protein